jgi:hypothetical protein
MLLLRSCAWLVAPATAAALAGGCGPSVEPAAKAAALVAFGATGGPAGEIP